MKLWLLGLLAGALALSPAVTFAATADIDDTPGAPTAAEMAEPPSDGASPLTGRVLLVSSAADIVLRPHEVILTFDDGPKPGTTDSIVKTLNAYGVKATFLMVGSMALRHPDIVRSVFLSGNTVGTHTFDHQDLSKLDPDAALDDIQRGEDAVRKALAPIGAAPSPFFRFPYLAQTKVLRADLALSGRIALGAQLDSDDYFTSTPDRLLRRILKGLDRTGSGIILMHDIHARTAKMLPDLLQELEARGYTVVQLVYRDAPFLGVPLRTATNGTR